MNLELIDTIDLPEYAPCYLEYGIGDNLNDEDIKNLDLFLKQYSDYDSLYYEFGEEPYFSHSPAFGLPSGCLETKVFGVLKPSP